MDNFDLRKFFKKQYLAEGRLLKEDVSPRFIKKYLTLPPPDEDFKNNDDYLKYFDIEDIESYSDRDKAILIFLDDQHGIELSDELAKGIKDKSTADIIKYFQDEDYEYMSYGVMKKQLGVPVVTTLTWDETGGPRGSEDAFYYSTNHKRKLNKVWRTKYPELEIPKWNDRYKNYDTREKIAQELDDYYRGQARKQKGIDLEVPYEEYAAMYVQALKDEGAIIPDRSTDLSKSRSLKEIENYWFIDEIDLDDHLENIHYEWEKWKETTSPDPRDITTAKRDVIQYIVNYLKRSLK